MTIPKLYGIMYLQSKEGIKMVSKIFSVVCLILVVWVFTSFIEVNVKNFDGIEISDANFFSVMIDFRENMMGE